MTEIRQAIRDFPDTPGQEGITKIRDIVGYEVAAILQYMNPPAAEPLHKLRKQGTRSRKRLNRAACSCHVRNMCRAHAENVPYVLGKSTPYAMFVALSVYSRQPAAANKNTF